MLANITTVHYHHGFYTLQKVVNLFKFQFKKKKIQLFHLDSNEIMKTQWKQAEMLLLRLFF